MVSLLQRVWELRDNVSAYDAGYIALAELLQCPLLTADARKAGPYDAVADRLGPRYVRCDLQLCAPPGTRTPNPLIKSQLLCQLS